MKKTICFLVFLLIVTIAVSSLAGCGEQTLTRVRLNEVTRSVFYAPLYVAIDQGFLDRQRYTGNYHHGLINLCDCYCTGGVYWILPGGPS